MHDTTTSTAPQTAICTLFEGDYHYGLAAFVNSLFQAGYQGTVWVGYRGALPPWLGQLQFTTEDGQQSYRVAERIRLVFLPVDPATHMTNYKPEFMLRLFREQPIDYLWYFDPDIWLKFSWNFFARWQNYGIALCEEVVRHGLSARHPLRLQWADFGRTIGLGEPTLRPGYFNGGLVGLQRAHLSFLELWQKIIAEAPRTGVDLGSFFTTAAEHIFAMQDQDALNMATLYTPHPLTTLGPEGMGFTPGWNAMMHAVAHKPWRVNFFVRALGGVPPSNAMKTFFLHLNGPIRPYSKGQLFGRRLNCQLATLIGRFYRRG